MNDEPRITRLQEWNRSKAEAATRLIRCEPYCTRRNPMKELISTVSGISAYETDRSY
jgi:hypothetical protein